MSFLIPEPSTTESHHTSLIYLPRHNANYKISTASYLAKRSQETIRLPGDVTSICTIKCRACADWPIQFCFCKKSSVFLFMLSRREETGHWYWNLNRVTLKKNCQPANNAPIFKEWARHLLGRLITKSRDTQTLSQTDALRNMRRNQLWSCSMGINRFN